MEKRFIVTKSQLRRLVQKANSGDLKEVNAVKNLIASSTGNSVEVNDLTGKQHDILSAFNMHNAKEDYHYLLTERDGLSIHVLKTTQTGGMLPTGNNVVYWGKSEMETLKPTKDFGKVKEFIGDSDD